jgi:hypothetical protein
MTKNQSIIVKIIAFTMIMIFASNLFADEQFIQLLGEPDGIITEDTTPNNTVPTKNNQDAHEAYLKEMLEATKNKVRIINNQTELDTYYNEMYGWGNMPTTRIQPDGTEVTFLISPIGHNGLRFHDENNYRIGINNKGFYAWTIQRSDGGLWTSQYPIHLFSPESLGIEPGLRETPEYIRKQYLDHLEYEKIRKIKLEEQRKFLEEINNSNETRSGDTRSGGYTPHTGSVNSLVLFVIPDSTIAGFQMTYGQYNTLLNSPKGTKNDQESKYNS